MKQADRADEGRAGLAEPGRERAAEDGAPPVFRGKDLRIPDATPEQLARILLRGGAEPRPKARKPTGGG